MTSISKVKADWYGLFLKIQKELRAKPTWKNFIATDAGISLMEQGASMGLHHQENLERSRRERSPETALINSSLLSLARTLGVRISRKKPAQANVILNRVGSTKNQYTINPYQTFASDLRPLYNRTAITFPQTVSQISVPLFEGRVFTHEHISDGTDYQIVVLPHSNFQVSDLDIRVVVGDLELTMVYDGIWNYKNRSENSLVVQDLTTAFGDAFLLFGSTQYGYKPHNGTVVNITYTITDGIEGNSTDSLTGRSVLFSRQNTTISGTATTELRAGGDQTRAQTYKAIASLIYASRGRAITRADYNAIAFQYPGVIDARLLGQADFAPRKKSALNLIRVSLLTSLPMNTAAFDDFVRWMSLRGIKHVRYERYDPTVKDYSITASIWCNSGADLEQVRGRITAKLKNLFALKFGSLLRNIYLSDMYNNIKNASHSIQYVKFPQEMVSIISRVGIPQSSAAPFTGGSLVPGGYRYYVTARTLQGQTLYDSVINISIDDPYDAIRNYMD